MIKNGVGMIIKSCYPHWKWQNFQENYISPFSWFSILLLSYISLPFIDVTQDAPCRVGDGDWDGVVQGFSLSYLFCLVESTWRHFLLSNLLNILEPCMVTSSLCFCFRCYVESSTDSSTTSARKQAWIKKRHILHASYCF